MKPLAMAAAALVIAVAACSGETAEPTTTTPPTTTQPTTGMPVVESCIEQVNELAAEVDLGAEDALAQFETVFTDANPEVCAFLTDGPAIIGVSDEDAYAALEKGLNPELFDLLGTPTYEPFEYKVDNL